MSNPIMTDLEEEEWTPDEEPVAVRTFADDADDAADRAYADSKGGWR